jgi:hypothetical protein
MPVVKPRGLLRTLPQLLLSAAIAIASKALLLIYSIVR